MDTPAPGLYSKAVRYVVSFALLYGLILHPIAMIRLSRTSRLRKRWITWHRVWACRTVAIPDRLLSVSSATKLLTKLLNENNALPPLANFKDDRVTNRAP